MHEKVVHRSYVRVHLPACAERACCHRFKRFAHCDDGLVTVKTCECHAELLGGRREGISDSDGEHARVERVRCSRQRLHAHRWRAG